MFSVAASGQVLNWSAFGPFVLSALFQGSTQFTEDLSLAKVRTERAREREVERGRERSREVEREVEREIVCAHVSFVCACA